MDSWVFRILVEDSDGSIMDGMGGYWLGWEDNGWDVRILVDD